MGVRVVLGVLGFFGVKGLFLVFLFFFKGVYFLRNGVFWCYIVISELVCKRFKYALSIV